MFKCFVSGESRGDSLLLFGAGGWRLALTSPEVLQRKNEKMSLLPKLLNQEAQEEFHQAWSNFFFNPEAIQKLQAEVTQPVASELLASGQCGV